MLLLLLWRLLLLRGLSVGLTSVDCAWRHGRRHATAGLRRLAGVRLLLLVDVLRV